MKIKLEKFKIIKFDEEKHMNLIPDLRILINEAYAPMAAQGMRFLGSYQDEEKTLERLRKGESYLGFFENELVSTITLVKGGPIHHCPLYRRSDVCFFMQFAVKTKFQGLGIGRIIMDMIENRAKELGSVEITSDTSEHAHHLIEIYKARNYKIVAEDSWDTTNYKSVLMSKELK